MEKYKKTVVALVFPKGQDAKIAVHDSSDFKKMLLNRASFALFPDGDLLKRYVIDRVPSLKGEEPRHIDMETVVEEVGVNFDASDYCSFSRSVIGKELSTIYFFRNHGGDRVKEFAASFAATAAIAMSTMYPLCFYKNDFGVYVIACSSDGLYHVLRFFCIDGDPLYKIEHEGLNQAQLLGLLFLLTKIAHRSDGGLTI